MTRRLWCALLAPVMLLLSQTPIRYQLGLDDIDHMEIGNQYQVKFQQNGLPRQGSFTLTQDPALETLPDEAAPEAARERRKAWLKEK